ncbi:MAG: DUF4238 domain-containing protein [Cyclobacteriaceae bacterium]|nr:DUF4238 domain-containing protein [Cyclobacteriaceae bacterium]
MNEQLSRHHHYIPVFLIKKFAGEQKQMWVYDKRSKRFNKSPQSPKAIFYEMGRNLSEFKGNQVDYIEKIYGEIDETVAKTLDKVLTAGEMDGPDLDMLIYFVALMKWRVPKLDSLAGDLSSSLKLRDLGINVRPKNPTDNADPKVIEGFDELEIMKDVKRFLLSTQVALNPLEFGKAHKGSYIIEHFGPPSLLGDCITIERENNDINKLNDFVFPLSDTTTLISKDGCLKQHPHNIFPTWKDLAIFHLSESKVACRDRNYLETIIKIYDTLLAQGKTDKIVQYIFDLIP